MHWGNPGATSESDGAVFTAANGFEVVYHLSNSMDDASSNNRNATDSGTSDTSDNEYIGRGRNFDGGTDLITSAMTASLPGPLTISA